MSDALRARFESMNRDSYGFKRSRRGTYQNPVIARDWKWFQAGADAAKTSELATDSPPTGGLTECDMGDSYE